MVNSWCFNLRAIWNVIMIKNKININLIKLTNQIARVFFWICFNKIHTINFGKIIIIVRYNRKQSSMVVAWLRVKRTPKKQSKAQPRKVKLSQAKTNNRKTKKNEAKQRKAKQSKAEQKQSKAKLSKSKKSKVSKAKKEEKLS